MSFKLCDEFGSFAFRLPGRGAFPLLPGLLVGVCKINLISIDSSIVTMNSLGSCRIVGRFFVEGSFRNEGDAIAGDFPLDDRSFALEARANREGILRIGDNLATH